ncbi:MAG: peptidoglycan editing factor PgeF [Oscillospiraceae bacterium]|nr:peptidoglycan editing factor PgeF [Oscillospiraceae bacterium]
MAFTRHDCGGLVYHTSSLLDGVKHAFTTRLGGVSEGMYASLNLRFSCEDKRENVIENYRLLCAAIGVDAERAVPTHQLHHANIRAVTEDDAGKLFRKPRDYEDVDGLITNVPGIPLFIYSADCGITLLHDPVSGCIGAVHSGWRGVALGILPKTAEAMCRTYGAKPENIRVAMGAGIGQCCFETDSDVPDAMRDAIGASAEPFMERRGEKWHIDLRGINVHRLRKIGISEEQIDLLPLCTACNPDLYWSHRLTGNSRGVQGAVISLGKE